MTIIQLINVDELQFVDGLANVPNPVIPNTIMRVRGSRNGDGVVTISNVRIKPAEGYLLHDTTYDSFNYDEETFEPIGIVSFGYRSTEGSVGYNYDFTPVEMQDETGATVMAYGSRQFFCKPISEVGEGAEIFGGNTEPEHEVI